MAYTYVDVDVDVGELMAIFPIPNATPAPIIECSVAGRPAADWFILRD